MQEEEFANLFRLLKLIGGRFIIVEDGKPLAVLMEYSEFQELALPKYAAELASKIEEANKEITNAQLQDLREEVVVELPDIRLEPLT